MYIRKICHIENFCIQLKYTKKKTTYKSICIRFFYKKKHNICVFAEELLYILIRGYVTSQGKI